MLPTEVHKGKVTDGSRRMTRLVSYHINLTLSFFGYTPAATAAM